MHIIFKKCINNTNMKYFYYRGMCSTFITNDVTKNTFVYGNEVREAKKNGMPIVALESTIITHGMPYPDNYETAIDVENIVRKTGAVPATVAILEGKVHVGITKENIKQLSKCDRRNTLKCSRRDFSYVTSQKLNGGTTVSGTMLVAYQADIPIMATGGIGGVHRGAELTFDVSADLTEFSRTPVAVVCAGVKAILDIPKTLEFLETQGVPVVTVGETYNFPAFYSRETLKKIKAPLRVSSTNEAADLIKAQRELGINTGMILAVPIPVEFSLDPQDIESVIQKALEDAKRVNIFGKEVTPFLLDRVAKFTGGRSLESNKALIKNNARVAAEIALQLINRPESHSKRNAKIASGSTKNLVVIGGAAFDTTIVIKEPRIIAVVHSDT